MKPKLFTPISLVHGLPGAKHMTIVWFCPARAIPIGPYEQLIKDYNAGGASHERQHWREMALDEHLTEAEADELKGVSGGYRIPTHRSATTIAADTPCD